MDYKHLVEHMDDPVFQQYGDGIFCWRCLESTGSTKYLPRRLILKGKCTTRLTSKTESILCHGAPQHFDTVVEHLFNEQVLGSVTTRYSLEEITVEELKRAWKSRHNLDYHFKRNGKMYRINKSVVVIGSTFS